MADYFTNFSLVLPLTPAQREYAMFVVNQAMTKRHDDAPLPESFPASLEDAVEDWSFETELEDDGIWIHSEYGGQESACAFIQHLLEKFDFAPAVTFEWSHDCSKPLTDAFGGGAAFVTATEIETFSTGEWLSKMTC